VGNGLVNAYKVLNYKSTLSYTKFELNDTRYFEQYHDIDITNNDAVPVSYTFAVEAAGDSTLFFQKSAMIRITRPVSLS